MTGWWLPLVAFCAMFGEDLVGVLLVQSEAEYRLHRAALMDMAGDLLNLVSLAAIGDGIVAGHLLLTAVTVAARLAADYAGTYTGVRIGRRINRIEGQ